MESLSQNYECNYKTIGIKMKENYFFNTFNGIQTITKLSTLLLHENSQFEVISSSSLLQSYSPIILKHLKFKLYKKKIKMRGIKQNKNFIIKQNEFQSLCKKGNYLIEDLNPPYYQYSLTEEEVKKYLILIDVNSNVESKENLNDNATNNNDIDLQMNNDSDISSFEFVEEEEILSGSHRPITSESIKFHHYWNNSEDTETLVWNLNNITYIAVEIQTNVLSIEYSDPQKLHLPCQSRYQGKRGDFLVINTNGYIFGIFSPFEFHTFFESEPYFFENQPTQNMSTSTYCIKKIKMKSLTGRVLSEPAAAYWNGTIEYGGYNQNLEQYIIQITFDSDSTSGPSIIYPPIENVTPFSTTPTIIPSNIYQWIMTTDEFGETFFTKTPSDMDRDESQTRSILYRGEKEPPLSDPFTIYSQNIPCWRGKLSCFIPKFQPWEEVFFEIYPASICVKTITNGKISLEIKACYLFEEFLSIGKNEDYLQLELPNVTAKPKENRTFFRKSSSIGDNFLKIKFVRNEIYDVTLDDLQTLFSRCVLWSKRKEMCDYCENAKFIQGPTEKLNSIAEYLASIRNDEDRSLLLTSPLNELDGHETLLHIAIRTSQHDIAAILLNGDNKKIIAETNYAKKLSIHSFISHILDFDMFNMLISVTSSELFTEKDSDGNNLLMLLLSRDISSLLVQILKEETQSFNLTPDYLNTKNRRGETPLLILLSSLNKFINDKMDQSKCRDFLNLLDILLERGCNPNETDTNGNNCLHKVCYLLISLTKKDKLTCPFYLDIMQRLTKNNNTSLCATRNERGETPLCIIAQSKYSISTDIINHLIGDINATENQHILNHTFPAQTWHSPIHICVHQGNYDFLSKLIAQPHININQVNCLDYTPLDILEQQPRTNDFLRCGILLPKNATNSELFQSQNNFPETKVTFGIDQFGHQDIHLGSLEGIIHHLCTNDIHNNVNILGIVLGTFYFENNHLNILTILEECRQVITQAYNCKGIVLFLFYWLKLCRSNLGLLKFY